MRFTRVVAGVAACAFVPGVATAQEPAPPVSVTVRQDSAAPLAPVTVRAKKARPSRDVLTREELAAKPAANLFDLVMTLRSQWMRGPATVRSTVGLTGSGRVTAGPIPGTIVYVDGRALGPLTTLRTIPAEDAERLCYYPLNKAQARFGLGVQAPALEVITRSTARADDAC